jgi:hypothetical protein
MLVTFRCKRSGNKVSFSNEGDIDGLRKHEGYEEIKDEAVVPDETVEVEETAPQEVLKRRGRPPKRK